MRQPRGFRNRPAVVRTVQDFLGHADPRMTSRYAHVVDMAKRNPALFIPVKVG
jgi:integrase